MDKKQRNFRLSDEQYEAVKAFIQAGCSSNAIQEQKPDIVTKIPAESPLHSASVACIQFAEQAVEWFRTMTKLQKMGVLDQIPDAFPKLAVQNPRPSITTFVQPEQSWTSGLPIWLDDIIQNKAPYPDECDCDKQQAKVLHNDAFKALFKMYRATPNDINVRTMLMNKINELL